MGNQTPSGIEKQIESLPENEKIWGFINVNNICYANSVLQCLYSCKGFRNKILNLKYTAEEHSMLKALNDLFITIDTKKKKSGSMDIKRFIASVKRNNQEFNNEDHHDSHEFLMWLLDNLNETMKNYNKNAKYNSELTFISEIFEGKQSSIIKCLNCENISQKSETYLHLSVDVEQNTSLTYCLKQYIRKELLRMKDKFYCEVCNCLQEAERQVMLETLPKILIVQLKRFKIINQIQKKLNYCINIPYDLRLDFLLKEKEKYKNNTLYNLFAVIVHVGSGNEYGHYYCIVKIAGRWIKFDDDVLNVLEKNDLNEYFGNPDEEFELNYNYCAYLLFYEIAETE